MRLLRDPVQYIFGYRLGNSRVMITPTLKTLRSWPQTWRSSVGSTRLFYSAGGNQGPRYRRLGYRSLSAVCDMVHECQLRQQAPILAQGVGAPPRSRPSSPARQAEKSLLRGVFESSGATIVNSSTTEPAIPSSPTKNLRMVCRIIRLMGSSFHSFHKRDHVANRLDPTAPTAT
jgi:hypothetical protein